MVRCAVNLRFSQTSKLFRVYAIVQIVACAWVGGSVEDSSGGRVSCLGTSDNFASPLALFSPLYV